MITGDVREDILLNLLAQPQFENVKFIRVEGPWDAVRPQVAEALHRAGLADSAVVAKGGGRLYPWPVGEQGA